MSMKRDRLGSLRRAASVAPLLLVLVFAVCSDLNAASQFRWDAKKGRVTANFRDWPLEKVLLEIAVATKWDVKVPESSGVMVSGTYKDLPPGQALKHMFGHLNYAVFSSPKGGKTRLQVFLLRPEDPKDDSKKAPAKKPSTARANPFNRTSGGKPNYADVMKRFDKNGDGLISNAEREAARKALGSGTRK